MNSEDSFRKSLADMLASKEFSFDEANWDKARQLIDANKKPKRIAPYMVAAALLILSVAGGIYLLSGSFATPEKTQDTLANTSSATPLAPSTVAAPELNVPQTEAAVNSKPQPSPQEIKPAPQNPPVSDLATASTPAENSNPLTPEQLSAIAPKLSIDLKRVVTQPSDPTLPANTNPLTAETPAVNDPLLAVNTPPAVQPEPAKQNPDTSGNDTQSSDTPVTEATNLNSDLPQKLKPQSENTPEQNEKVTQEPVVVTPPAATESISPAAVLPGDNDKGELGKPKEDLVIFSIEAGTNYAYGWKNPGSTDASGFNPVVGLNYFNNFKPKMSLSVGLHYTSINNMSFSNYTSKVVHLGLGEESNVSVFTPEKAHYLVAPLRFNYNLTSKNTVGMGFNMAYLLTVDSKVYTYTERLNRKYDETTSHASGYVKGFKSYDTQLALFYKRSIYKGLAANLELYYGLTDIKDNGFFNSGVFERNSGLKLTLVYNFLKK